MILCDRCRRAFIPSRAGQRFCSDTCRAAAWNSSDAGRERAHERAREQRGACHHTDRSVYRGPSAGAAELAAAIKEYRQQHPLVGEDGMRAALTCASSERWREAMRLAAGYADERGRPLRRIQA